MQKTGLGKDKGHRGRCLVNGPALVEGLGAFDRYGVIGRFDLAFSPVV